MSDNITPHEALIYTMVTMSAVDRQMSDSELSRIGDIATTLPVFKGFDEENIVQIAQACGEILGRENGLNDVLDSIAEGLPQKLYETAYAVAVEIAAVDLEVKQEELRFLSLLRDRLRLDKLVISAIERGARARHAVM